MLQKLTVVLGFSNKTSIARWCSLQALLQCWTENKQSWLNFLKQGHVIKKKPAYFGFNVLELLTTPEEEVSAT